MTAPVFIHILSLDTVGGVESLYVHFVTEALAQGRSTHYTSVCGKPPHTKFSSHFGALGYKAFLEEHIMGLRLPRLLRTLVHLRRAMVHEIVKPSLWIYWNRIEEHSPPGMAAYYEHGAAWNVPVSKKRMKFLSRCSHMMANSNAAAVILKEKWDVHTPITVVANPLRPDISIRETPRALTSHRPLRLGFIGRLVPVKGLLVALHALKLLLARGIDATLSIAGVGPMKEIGRRRSHELGIEPSVHWMGCLDRVTDFYDGIDILLTPSIREPLGLVSLEAAARGVPVIAAAVDGLPEAVLNEKTGICVAPTLSIYEAKNLLISHKELPDCVVDMKTRTLVSPKVVDPQHCVEAIEQLLLDSKKYAQFSANALCHARERADFPLYFNTLHDILTANGDALSPPSDSL